MTLADLASDTWLLDLGEPDDISVAVIAQWYRSHIGDLNNYINNGYNLNSAYEIVDENNNAIDENAASIFKKLYNIYYLNKQSQSFLGANGVDSIKSINQDGIIVTLTDKNQIAKNYSDLYKEAKLELKSLLNNYKYNRTRPSHVETDDRLPHNPPLIINPLNNSNSPDFGYGYDKSGR
jgi:hypothetical protein